MLNIINKSTYLKQIITLMSGSLMAQVIMLGSIPLLTRLYSPSEFGIYSLFISVITIIGSVSSLKYDQAIMLPKNNKDAQALVFLSILITCIITFLSLILILVFNSYLVNYFGNNQLIVFLIPVGILFLGLIQIFNAFSSRNQFYREMSKVRVLNAFNLSLVQISTKYIASFDGLIFGKLAADFTSVIYLIRFHINKKTLQLKNISKRRIKFNIDKHHHFPKFQSITVFLNAVSQNIPVLLLGALYSIEIAGFYALTIRVLRTPITLIGSATREVFYQKASNLHAQNKSFFNLYIKTTTWLIKIFIIPFMIIILFSNEIFSFVFGEKWEESGLYASVLIYWYFFAFINSPSVMSFSILQLQSFQLKIEFISLILRLNAIYLGYKIYESVVASLILFTIVGIIINGILILKIYMTLKEKENNESKNCNS